MAVVSELSDERFWGEAMSQALDTERAERLRLTRENKELQVSLFNVLTEDCVCFRHILKLFFSGIFHDVLLCILGSYGSE